MGLEFITFYLFCGSQLYLSRTGRVFPGSYNHYESVENWRISPRPSRYFTGNMSFLNHWISAACYFKNTSVVVYFCNVKIDILHPLILWAWSPSEDRQKTHSLINGPGSDKFADFDIKGGIEKQELQKLSSDSSDKVATQKGCWLLFAIPCSKNIYLHRINDWFW